jgi:CheY-like chemotaxis protein
MLAAHLETEKCEVRTAADGREAIDLMARFSPDLVLLDLLMPGMDGISFLNHLRSTPRFRFVPIVIVTAKDLTVAESQQLGRMAQEVVRKGDTLQTDLERVLHRFLEAQVPPWREGVHTEGKE